MAEKEYIEREALQEIFENRMQDNNIMCPVIKVLEVIEIIEKQPTADVAPVRHGVWASEETAVTCTACGRSYDTDFEIKRNVIRDFDYCPNCGAKMEGESNA